MSASGLSHWEGRFSASADLSTTVWQTAFDPRSGSYVKKTGDLYRPKIGSLQWTNSGALAKDIEIIIENLSAAS